VLPQDPTVCVSLRHKPGIAFGPQILEQPPSEHSPDPVATPTPAKTSAGSENAP